MRTICKVIILLVLILGLVACSPSATQIQFAIAETQAAVPYPTQTAYPTQTPYPTITKSPLETVTPQLQSKVRGITWAELVDFILKDHTNWNTWTPAYTCVNFSMDLAKNAKSVGIDAWVVGAVFADQPEGHAFVAFPTIDGGVIWIEPQTDDAYVVADVGQPLCLANNPSMCWDKGVITHIIQPAQCDPVSHECWVGTK